MALNVFLVSSFLGSTVLSAQEGSAVIQKNATGDAAPGLRLLQTLSASHAVYPGMGLESGTTNVTWSPDGARLAAYGRDYAMIEVWDANGNLIRATRRYGPHFLPGNALAFVAGHSRLITIPSSTVNTDLDQLNSATLSVFDIESGTIVRDITGPDPGASFRQNEATILEVSPDQSLAVVTYGPLNNRVAGVYSTRDWQRITVLTDSRPDLPDFIEALTFSPDGRLLAVGRMYGQVQIYDTASWRLTRTIDAFSDVHPSGPPSAATLGFSPDGKSIVVGGNAGGSVWLFPNGNIAPAGQGIYRTEDPADPVRVFQVADGSPVTSVGGFLAGIWINGVRGLAWSPTSSLVAFIAANGDLHLWDPSHPNRPQTVVSLGLTAYSLAFSPDGSRLAVCVATGVDLFEVMNPEEK